MPSVRDKLAGAWERAKGWLLARGAVLISLAVTLAALWLYGAIFIGERPGFLYDFLSRQELATFDLRFRMRDERQPDPRIVIVDVDQKSQEVLGRWPFSRGHFARMLDALREDGARVAAFDITFSQPDESVKPIQVLRERLAKQGAAASPALARELARLEEQFDYDKQFATAIQRFRHVVLGNFFLYSDTDLKGLDNATLDRFADLAAYHPFPQVRAAASARGAASYRNLVGLFDERGILPRGAEANLDVFTSTLPVDTSSAGFFNVFADPDGVVRRSNLTLPYGRSADRADWDLFASLDLQAMRFYLDVPNEQVVLNFGAAGVENIEIGPTFIKPDDLGRVIINFRGGARTYRYVSIADVVQRNFSPGTFRDKLVLIGATATGIGDHRATPFVAVGYPAVEIHANVIDNALHEDFIRRGPLQVAFDIAAIVLFGVPLGLLLGLLPAKRIWMGLLVIVPFLGLVHLAFVMGNWWLNVVAPVALTLAPNVIGLSLFRIYIEEREKRRTHDAFRQYISPEVIRRLLKSPDSVKPRKIVLTTLFTDVPGFTTVAEQADAQEVAHLLNDYLTEMTRVVFVNQGTLDKYIGDALMAFWGAPFDEAEHAQKACRAGLMMVARLAELKQQWRAEGKPILDIRVGINSGVASVGNMGSRLRYGYTVIGDSVNLASRLEGMNKVYGSRILVSEDTRARDVEGEFLFREMDLIRVQGRFQPVAVYELVALAKDGGDWPERIAAFEAGLRAYRERDWLGARVIFERLLDRWPDDNPAQLFLARCDDYLLQAPAPHWDGVYVAKEK